MTNIIPKVSIIVPVYNLSLYLPQCMDSLKSQTLKDIEIICVNDASTDNSLDILLSYAKGDERFKIINLLENKRQGGARNAGIKIATGEYLGFVDGDDWVDIRMYEDLYNKAITENSDIVTSDYWLVKPDSKKYVFNNDTKKLSLSIKERNRHLILKGIRLWTNIYSRALWEHFNFSFPEKLIYEDNSIVPIIPLLAKKITKCENAYYHYRVTNTSTTRCLNNPLFWDRVKSAEILLSNFKRYRIYDDYHEECDFKFIELYYFNTLISSALGFSHPPVNRISQLRKIIKEKYPDYKNNKYIKTISLKRKTMIKYLDISYPIFFYIIRFLKKIKK